MVRRLVLASLAAASLAAPSLAQSTPGGRVVLVLPFENRSGNPSLNWVGDSFPDTLDKRLNSAGFLTISQDDRRYSFDHLGLPGDFRPTRATTIRIAQQLDCNYVVIGSFSVAGGRIRIQSQVMNVNELKLSTPLEDSAELNRLFDAENAIAWKVARQIDPKFNVAEQTFLAAPGAVPLPAFEDYIRGTNAAKPEERLARLSESVKLVPDYAAALLALGKEQYAAKDFAAAGATLSKVPQDSPQALEAGFFLGLARFNTNNYTAAANAFDFVGTRLPLPEVLNNHGVALARQGKDGSEYFQKASASDPNDVDFHYNFAVSLFRRGDTASALKEADAALKLKPGDGDVATLRSRIAIAAPGTRLSANDPTFAPAERIRKSYSEASFRQVAFQLDQLRDARLAMLPPAQRAVEYNNIARDYMAQGLLPQAEEQFNSALEADSSNAAAHAGLAEIREKSGQRPEARAEAQTSIRLKPNVPAFLVLARLDLADKNIPSAVQNVNRATTLEPNNAQAIALRLSLQQQQH